MNLKLLASLISSGIVFQILAPVNCINRSPYTFLQVGRLKLPLPACLVLRVGVENVLTGGGKLVLMIEFINTAVL